MDKTDIIKYKRISIVGSPGSGKTTLAFYLQKQLGIPLYRMSDILKKYENIQEEETWEAFFDTFLSLKDWIIDGCCEKSIPYRLRQSDLFIFLDIPFIICMKRVLIRGIKNLFSIGDTVYKDYNESLGAKLKYLFGRKIYARVIVFRDERRLKLLDLIKDNDEERVIIIHNKYELRRLKKMFET